MSWMRMSAVAAAIALAGCYETYSCVPAVSEARRRAESPITPGIWCAVDAGLDAEGAVASVLVEDCLTASFEAGALSIAPLHPDPDDGDRGSAVFILADLGRGATLLETRYPEEERYTLYVAKTRENGLAVLPELELTPAIAAYAGEIGVAIEADEDGDYEGTPQDLRILDGEPDAVLALMHRAVSARFDLGNDDPELWDELMNEPIFYLRLDADPAEAPPEEAALIAQLEWLRVAIRFAMTLE